MAKVLWGLSFVWDRLFVASCKRNTCLSVLSALLFHLQSLSAVVGIGMRRPQAPGVLLCKQEAKSLLLADETFSWVCPAGVCEVFAQRAADLVLLPVGGGISSRLSVCSACWVFKHWVCFLCWFLSWHIEKSGDHLYCWGVSFAPWFSRNLIHEILDQSPHCYILLLPCSNMKVFETPWR